MLNCEIEPCSGFKEWIHVPSFCLSKSCLNNVSVIFEHGRPKLTGIHNISNTSENFHYNNREDVHREKLMIIFRSSLRYAVHIPSSIKNCSRSAGRFISKGGRFSPSHLFLMFPHIHFPICATFIFQCSPNFDSVLETFVTFPRKNHH